MIWQWVKPSESRIHNFVSSKTSAVPALFSS